MNLMEVNQTDHCLQFSCPERSVSPLYVFLCLCAAAAVLITACGNMLIIISVCHFKQLHTPTNMLILSLAVSDCLVGVFVMPFHLSRLTESCWIFGSNICLFFVLISFFVTSISIYNVALIAVDRYFAISNPFLYIEKVSVSNICIVILAMWFLLLSYNSALLYFNGNSRGLIMCPEQCLIVLKEIWSLVDLVFVFVVPCSAIILFYALVFVIAKKHATAIREINVQSKGSKNMADSMKSERKAAKVLSILVAVFLACLFPYFVYATLSNAIETQSFHNLVILLYLNSSINPMIYALFYPWFRRCIKIIFSLQIFTTDSALINVQS
ncbi:trace amine-associated receptor 13c-like [Electrophorus electricus]|uniref:G-protein coupled receptors family 1 profile domain-containing protein n=1 Tax=Electrophorus electricus TaxID=8005 RepID=A0A4W4DNH9_ELEEL|nr:trace amine-associated receptor 13c-like [Electrophorus electricus]